MNETKHEIMQRKIRNGKRKQFNVLYGTPGQIIDKLSKEYKPGLIEGLDFEVVKTAITPKSRKLDSRFTYIEGILTRVK